jgi:hypothetical protein
MLSIYAPFPHQEEVTLERLLQYVLVENLTDGPEGHHPPIEEDGMVEVGGHAAQVVGGHQKGAPLTS